MARGEIFTARIESIAAGGAGIARLEGKSVFVDLAAPDDLLRCRIKEDHKTWARAEIIEVLEASHLRSSPACPLYGRCGGCSLQHLAYEAQIEAKTAILSDAFLRIGGIKPPEIRVRPSSPYEYRNRVQFHRTADNYLGFKERKSSRLAVLNDCPIADKGIRKFLGEGKIHAEKALFLKKPRFTVYSRGTIFLIEGGTEQGKVPILGKEMMVNVSVFFQSNAEMLELLIGDLVKASSSANKKLPLADIYSGVGTLSAFLGEEFAEIDLVEENKSALTVAKENMPKGKKVNYYALSDTDWVKSPLRKNPYGFMVLDPPREGLSKSLREYLARNGPDLAAYVSCDPATLARDSRCFIEGGYIMKDLTLYDFYPQTAHIESMALFSRLGI